MPIRHFMLGQRLNTRLWVGLACLIMVCSFIPSASYAQTDPASESGNTQADTVTDLINMTVNAGYGAFYREDYWFPVRIRVRNQGDAINGKLIVRPETSGRVVRNAYSTPIDLPTGSDKTTLLYIQARNFAPRVIVELLDGAGNRRAQEIGFINAIAPHDLMHIVVTNPDAETLLLNSVRTGGFESRQARWQPDNIPTYAAALDAVNTMVFTDVDTDALTVQQMQAIAQWVVNGGHLVIIGGPAWQETASAFIDYDGGAMLPFIPDDTATVDNLNGLDAWIGTADDDRETLTGRAIIATGDVQASAEILASTADDDLPLLVRGTYGNGTVDYLTADPLLAPLRTWNNLGEFWYHMAATTGTHPSWTLGFMDYGEAQVAVGVLPGVSLLPEAIWMVAFLAAYIVVIGPINYVVLSRLNRRGWAWVTIPLFIVLFSALAWRVGFNLRGNDVIISRLNVVETWPTAEQAKLQQLVGLISPRRDTFSLAIDENRVLSVLPDPESEFNLINTNITQSTAEIVQQDAFSAQDFSVDGGIFANFMTQGTIDRPDIGGSMTLTYNGDGTQSLQGVVRNDSDIMLYDAVIIARELVVPLDDALAPNDLVRFSPDALIINAEGVDYPPPARIEFGFDLQRGSDARGIIADRLSRRTLQEVLGDDHAEIMRSNSNSLEHQIAERRQALLTSFMRDQYGSTSRGHDVYLMGWSDDVWGDDVSVIGNPSTTVDTTFYIVQLDVTIEEPPASQLATIHPDQFTWVMRDRSRESTDILGVRGANDFQLLADEALTMRFIPLAGAVLDDVQQMTITIDRDSSRGRDVVVSLWNWQDEEWEAFTDLRPETYVVDNPARFIGPGNMVDMNLYLDSELGSARIRGLSVSQSGTF